MGEICPQSLRAELSPIWQGRRDSFIFLILSVELGGGLRRVLQRGFHGECLNTDDFGVRKESVLSDMRNTFWDFDGFEGEALPKCIISNACDAIWNFD